MYIPVSTALDNEGDKKTNYIGACHLKTCIFFY